MAYCEIWIGELMGDIPCANKAVKAGRCKQHQGELPNCIECDHPASNTLTNKCIKHDAGRFKGMGYCDPDLMYPPIRERR